MIRQGPLARILYGTWVPCSLSTLLAVEVQRQQEVASEAFSRWSSDVTARAARPARQLTTEDTRLANARFFFVGLADVAKNK